MVTAKETAPPSALYKVEKDKTRPPTWTSGDIYDINLVFKKLMTLNKSSTDLENLMSLEIFGKLIWCNKSLMD